MSIRKLAAALAVAAAVPVLAQAPSRPPWPPQSARPPQPAQQPQAQPQPAPQPAPGAQAGQARALTPEQQQALAAVQAHHLATTMAADLATTRGSNDQVKNFGRWLANDHRRVQGELNALLKERGVADPNALLASPDRQRLEQEAQALGGRSGTDFDKAFIDFLNKNNPMFVEALKRARDVTPGQDARFKKFLDDVENLEEGHLSAARYVKSQRQARTPPAR